MVPIGGAGNAGGGNAGGSGGSGRDDGAKSSGDNSGSHKRKSEGVSNAPSSKRAVESDIGPSASCVGSRVCLYFIFLGVQLFHYFINKGNWQ